MSDDTSPSETTEQGETAAVSRRTMLKIGAVFGGWAAVAAGAGGFLSRPDKKPSTRQFGYGGTPVAPATPSPTSSSTRTPESPSRAPSTPAPTGDVTPTPTATLTPSEPKAPSTGSADRRDTASGPVAGSDDTSESDTVTAAHSETDFGGQGYGTFGYGGVVQ